MIPLLRRHAVRALDRDAIERLGIPGVVLMENAGRGAFDRIVERFGHALERVVIVGGPGQNGGDGWVVARFLHAAGYAPRALLVGDPARVQGDAAINLKALQALGIKLETIDEGSLAELSVALDAATLIVDALFGTGLDRPITGLYAQVIERVLDAAAPIVALDLPSGIDADTGAVLGVAIDADLTVTFAAHKRGLHQHPGCARAGELACVSIGVPAPSTSDCVAIENADVARWVFERLPAVYKGDGGHVLVIAGAPGKTGAALLAGLGAMRAGAGLVTLAARAQAREALDHKVIELMTETLPEGVEPALEHALALAANKNTALVGPGLGLDDSARALARQLALALPIPTVLDADALTAIGTELGMLRSASAPRVLTPHPGEAARMLGCTSAEVQADRYAAAEKLAELSGHVVVLKGARTIIAAPDRKLRVVTAGTPAMAVAGTGDVLAGVVAALLGNRGGAFNAASAAAQLHALAGERAACSDRGLLASELAAALPAALEFCRA